MTTHNLSRDEFRDALQKGLGRALIHVREHGTQDFQNEILHACLHNLVYDTDCEKPRTQWLRSFLERADNIDFFLTPILSALVESTQPRDVMQLIELTAHFARNGHPEAHRAIYDKFDMFQFEPPMLSPEGKKLVSFKESELFSLFFEAVLDLDGTEGLLHITEVMGSQILDPDLIDPEWWVFENILAAAEEHLGKEIALSALWERAETNKHVRAFMDRMTRENDAKEADILSGNSAPRHDRTLEQILSDIESGAYTYGYLVTCFGQKATPNEIDLLFTRLLQETRPEQILRYLWIFQKRAMPKLDNRILALAKTGDNEIQTAAFRALSNLCDPSIRDLARHLLQNNPESLPQGVLALFNRNFKPEDAELIRSSLWIPNDDDEHHAIGFGIIDLAKAQLHPDLSPCLLWVYENTPCTNCRENAVKLLINLGRAPLSILEECLWDCKESICELAETAMKTNR